MRRQCAHFSYANVMATVAVFVALGGTSYAVASLPKNSVGAPQIKAKAVGSSELRTRAIRSKHIHNGSVSAKDLSAAARRSLRGKQGPVGPPGPAAASLSAAVTAAGEVVGGTGAGTHFSGNQGLYEIRYDRDLRSCRAVASLARAAGNGAQPEIAPNGEIVTETTTAGVNVHTYNSQGQPTDLPFNLIVVC